MFAAGAVGGIGFYTFPTARMAPIVLVLFLFTLGRRGWQPRLLLPLLSALLITGLPLFATDRWNAISVARDRTVFGFQDSTTEGIGIRILENIPRSLLAFNYNPNPGHFVSGSLLDPVTAVFLVAGFAFALAHVHKPAYRLLVVWFGIDILFAGIFSPYDRVGYDRLHLALPVVALFVGVAMSLAARSVSTGLMHGRIAHGYLAAALFVAIAPVLAYVNLQRFFVDSPMVNTTTEERMALGGIESAGCKGSERTLAVIREPRPLLNPAIATYRWTDRDVMTRSLTDARSANDYDAFTCVVIVEVPDASTVASVASLVNRLEGNFKFEEKQVLSNGSPRFRAIVLSRNWLVPPLRVAYRRATTNRLLPSPGRSSRSTIPRRIFAQALTTGLGCHTARRPCVNRPTCDSIAVGRPMSNARVAAREMMRRSCSMVNPASRTGESHHSGSCRLMCLNDLCTRFAYPFAAARSPTFRARGGNAMYASISTSGTEKTSVPPGLRTRCASAKNGRTSGMCSSTLTLMTVLNAASPNGKRRASPCTSER